MLQVQLLRKPVLYTVNTVIGEGFFTLDVSQVYY